MNPPDQPTPTLAPTPRTDAVQKAPNGNYRASDYRNVARTLERELTAEREKVRVLREALAKYQHTVIAGGTNPARAALAATKQEKSP
jgi:hypothetical protein